MKKVLAIILTLCMFCGFSAVAMADDEVFAEPGMDRIPHAQTGKNRLFL